jgi:hypothetical protein
VLTISFLGPLGISIAKDLIPTICKLRRAVAFEFSTLLPVDQLKVLGLRPTVSSVDTTQCDSYFGFIHKERAEYVQTIGFRDYFY